MITGGQLDMFLDMFEESEDCMNQELYDEISQILWDTELNVWEVITELKLYFPKPKVKHGITTRHLSVPTRQLAKRTV